MTPSPPHSFFSPLHNPNLRNSLFSALSLSPRPPPEERSPLKYSIKYENNASQKGQKKTINMLSFFHAATIDNTSSFFPSASELLLSFSFPFFTARAIP